jgi:hypothetical protein
VVKAIHGDLQALSFSAQEVGFGNAAILKNDLGGLGSADAHFHKVFPNP